MDPISACRRKVFHNLWHHYFGLVPYAPLMLEAFQKRNDEWIEDHVAFRTLPGEHTGSHILQGVFEALGYVRKDDYHFEAKQLKAFWLCPPDIHGHTREASPKIFISELIPSRFSSEFQEIVRRLTSQVTASPLPRLRALRAKLANGDSAAASRLTRECVSLLSNYPSWSRPSLHD